MDKRIGIIGLGRVGMPAAKAYLAAGYSVFGNDIHSELMTELENFGGVGCPEPARVAEKADLMLLMVLDDAQVINVMLGKKGILNAAKEPATIICMSTINRSLMEDLTRRCIEAKIELIDCPFTGGPVRIPGGNLTLIAAAPQNILEKIKPHLEVLGKIFYAGEKQGLGQAVKHCNQLLVGATHAATMEVIHLARLLGLDTHLVAEVVGNGIAGSDYFRLLAESVLSGKPSPGGLGQMCKDVSIVVNTTREVKMPALVATAMSQYFLEAESLGMQGQEGADLIKVLQKTRIN